MGKVKIKASKEAVEKSGDKGDFEQPRPGVYIAELKECKPGYAKGEDNKPDKSRPYLECIYRLTHVCNKDGSVEALETNVAQMWDYVSFSESSEWKMAQFGIAMGLPIKNGAIDGEIEIEDKKPGTIIGRKVKVRIKSDKDNEGEYRGKIGSVFPVEGGEALPDDGMADDEGSEDAADPFGEGGDEELLTEDALAEMELKELGALATEFDLTPQDFVVKVKGKVDSGKTKAAIIAAILEAQGADDEEVNADAADDGDDEDPF